MTDLTAEQMLEVIRRSLTENAARFRNALEGKEKSSHRGQVATSSTTRSTRGKGVPRKGARRSAEP
jgi:ribosomal protein L1